MDITIISSTYQPNFIIYYSHSEYSLSVGRQLWTRIFVTYLNFLPVGRIEPKLPTRTLNIALLAQFLIFPPIYNTHVL